MQQNPTSSKEKGKALERSRRSRSNSGAAPS
jgi:hypothetical protein